MRQEHYRSLIIGPATTIKEAMQKLNDTGRKILFVADQQEKLIGTLSDGDIRRGIIGGTSMTSPVASIMHSDFISLRSDSPDIHNKARWLMQQHFIEQVPILDDDGAIVDILFWIDFLSEAVSSSSQPHQVINTPVVIMAGGKGTRLDPFTKILPKPLIPLGDKPIIESIMDRYHENGFYRFTLVINYKKEMIKAYFSDKKVPYELNFVEEEEYLGTAGGLSLLRGRVAESFIVTNCDTIIEGQNLDFLKWHRDHGNIMTIIGSHKEITVQYGVLHMHNGALDKIEEKPKLDLFINTGTYVFEPTIFGFIKNRDHLDMDKLIGMVKTSYPDRIGVYPHWGGWYDIGQWDEYRKSVKELGNA